MNKVVVGLGSNIDPDENIRKARAILAEQFQVLKESEFIRTAPIGYTDQDDFINGSVLLETDQEVAALKQSLKVIEDQLERKRSEIKFGPRTIDLDIVVFNGQVVDLDFYERDFLKKAVLELWPDLEY